MTTDLVADLGAVRDTRTLADTLRAERVRRGISQTAVARRMFMGRNAVVRMERRASDSGRTMPKLVSLAAYADALGLEIRISVHRKEVS